tara:strand:+ start:11553 stop:12581 length:1029 start_codon:yes stop_codon:yes gene_type:complete
MKKNNYYLITGGLGFIGSKISEIITQTDKNSVCVLLDNFTVYIDPIKSYYGDYRKKRFEKIINPKDYKDSKSSRIIVERGNASDPKITIELINKYKPKIIYHTAGMPLARLKNAVAKEFREGSVDSTTNIIESVDYVQKQSNYKLKRFLYVSSSMVYGNFKKPRVTEDEMCNPIEIYGTMKLAGEVVTKGMCYQYKIPYTIIRPSAVYGPTDMNQRVSQYFIEKALANETLKIHGKNEKLDFTFVDDLARGCILAANKSKGENQTFNITYGNSRSLLDFAKILSKHFKGLKYKIVSRDKKRPKRGTLINSKAKKLLGFKPQIGLEKGTKIYLDFFKKNYLKK